MRDRVLEATSFSSHSVSEELDAVTLAFNSRSAASLALARPQVRLTGAGTACDAGAQPRGSRCSLGGMWTYLPLGPAGFGRSGPSPGSGSADVIVTLMLTGSSDEGPEGCGGRAAVACALAVFLAIIGGTLRTSWAERTPPTTTLGIDCVHDGLPEPTPTPVPTPPITVSGLITTAGMSLSSCAGAPTTGLGGSKTVGRAGGRGGSSGAGGASASLSIEPSLVRLHDELLGDRLTETVDDDGVVWKSTSSEALARRRRRATADRQIVSAMQSSSSSSPSAARPMIRSRFRLFGCLVTETYTETPHIHNVRYWPLLYNSYVIMYDLQVRANSPPLKNVTMTSWIKINELTHYFVLDY